MPDIIKIHSEGLLRTQLKRISKWRIPAETRDEFIRFLDELAMGKVNKGKRLSEAAQLKYVNTLKVSLEFFNKPTKQISGKDIEAFEKALSTDRIKSALKGTPYSYASKVSIRKALKIYLRWKLGSSLALELAGWLDTRNREKTPDFLKEADVERLFQGCRTAEQRYIIAVLFDAGARAEEFINIRSEDIHLPEGKENFPKIALKEEYSKTKGRTVSLYWRHSLEAVRTFLNERMAEGIKAHEPVFEGSYGAMRMFLRRLGMRILKRQIHAHLFRHSSATYYATRLNRQELCYRFGWRFSSNMPDVYISRAGMENKELDAKFTHTEISVLNDALAKMKLDSQIKDERLEKLERKIAFMEGHFPAIATAYRKRPKIVEVEAAIQRKAGSKSSLLTSR